MKFLWILYIKSKDPDPDQGGQLITDPQNWFLAMMPRRGTGYLNKTFRTVFWTMKEQLGLKKSNINFLTVLIFFGGGEGFLTLFSSIFENWFTWLQSESPCDRPCSCRVVETASPREGSKIKQLNQLVHYHSLPIAIGWRFNQRVLNDL